MRFFDGLKEQFLDNKWLKYQTVTQSNSMWKTNFEIHKDLLLIKSRNFHAKKFYNFLNKAVKLTIFSLCSRGKIRLY